MTAEEFNEKYKDYLEDRFYGLGFDVPTVTKFLDDLFENVLTKIPGFTYAQIKLKFNRARFYTNIRGTSLIYLVEEKIDRLVKEHDERAK